MAVAILTGCHWPLDIFRFASQSGNPLCTASTKYPSSKIHIAKHRKHFPCTMDYRHNVNLVWFHVINNAVGAFYDLSDLI
jgi:hypothetical protein